METEEFISALKRFNARKGRPEKIYSDNDRTFVSAAKWQRNVMQDEWLREFLTKLNIKLSFNLGQFERTIGLVKQVFNGSVGNGTLTWSELQDVLRDVEVALSYVEEDVQLTVLTSNMLQFGRPKLRPELRRPQSREPLSSKASEVSSKVQGYGMGEVVYRVPKKPPWKTQPQTQQQRQQSLLRGDFVIIKGEEKNRGHWKLRIFAELIWIRPGQMPDGTTCWAKIASGTKTGLDCLNLTLARLFSGGI